MLFRREVLERLSAPEQLDQLMQITRPRNWFALSALGGLLIIAVVWGIFWTSPTTFAAQGLIVPTGGVQTVAAQTAGRVTDVSVHTGDTVNPGQAIATITPAEPANSPPTMVTASAAGRVLGVAAAAGDLVQSGSTIVALAPLDKPLQLVLYVPLSQVSGARPGQAVKVQPATVNPTTYGYLKGTISSVGAFPATMSEMRQSLGTDELVRSFTTSGPAVAITVDLTPDTGTPSGLKWSSPKGPPYPLSGGTFAKATIILQENHPFRLHF